MREGDEEAETDSECEVLAVKERLSDRVGETDLETEKVTL